MHLSMLIAQTRPCGGNVLLQSRSRRVSCHAKGKSKGPQKNEGLYFEYRDVEKQPESRPDTQKEQSEFSWVQRARGSVQQYQKQSSQASKRNNQKPRRQQPQQQQQQQRQHAQPGNAPEPAATPASTAAALDTPGKVAEAATAAAPEPATAARDGVTPTAAIPSSSAAREHRQATSRSSSNSSSSSNTKEDVVQQHKQRLLQRMKGASAAAPAAAAAATAAAVAAQDSQAAVTVNAAAAGSAAAVQELPGAFELDDEAAQLLQELLEMAEELSQAPDGFGLSSMVDSDPLADPLAAFTSDEQSPGPEPPGFNQNADAQQQQGFEGFDSWVVPAAGAASSSDPVMADADDADDADGDGFDNTAAATFSADLAAVRAAISQLQFKYPETAAAAAAAPGSQQQQQLVRTADLLAWEAEQAAKVTAKLTVSNRAVTSMESAVAAVQQDELRETGNGQEGLSDFEDDDTGDAADLNSADGYEELDDVIFGDYDDETEDSAAADDDTAWLAQEDPTLQKLLDANNAAFAQMLQELNEEADEDSSSSGSAGQQQLLQQDMWSGMGLQDWVEAAADTQAGVDSSSSGSSGSGLADLMGAIDEDPSLDSRAKMEAKMGIAGVFNPEKGTNAAAPKRRKAPGATAGGSSGSSNTSSSSSGTTAAGGGNAGGDAVPALLPRPMRPTAQ